MREYIMYLIIMIVKFFCLSIFNSSVVQNWCLYYSDTQLSDANATSDGQAVSTPRSDSQVSVSRLKNGSIRKISRKSANSSATSYQSLPKTLSQPFNESVSSSISSISVDSATKSIEHKPKNDSNVSEAQLLGISRQDTSTQKLIQETWADILNRESGLPKDKRNLSRPDLTVTPISSVNTTLARQDITDISTPSRTPSILRTSTTSNCSSSKSVTFTDTVNIKEKVKFFPNQIEIQFLKCQS